MFPLIQTIWALVFTSAIVSFTIYIPSIALADLNESRDNQVSVSMAWESIIYKEHEKTTGLESNSQTQEVVFGIEGVKQFGQLLIGARAIIPALIISNEEDVTKNNNPYQKNYLKYSWLRLDGYIGYEFQSLVRPYIGLRCSDDHQERDKLIIKGNLTDNRSTEEVRSWNLLFGLMGVGTITKSIKWHYWLEYYLPLDVEVTNSTMPSFKATDNDGRAFEVKGAVNYSYTNATSFGLLCYGGLKHWEGSDWKSIGSMSVKWPENDSYYIGIGVEIKTNWL